MAISRRVWRFMACRQRLKTLLPVLGRERFEFFPFACFLTFTNIILYSCFLLINMYPQCVLDNKKFNTTDRLSDDLRFSRRAKADNGNLSAGLAISGLSTTAENSSSSFRARDVRILCFRLSSYLYQYQENSCFLCSPLIDSQFMLLQFFTLRLGFILWL